MDTCAAAGNTRGLTTFFHHCHFGLDLRVLAAGRRAATQGGQVSKVENILCWDRRYNLPTPLYCTSLAALG